MIVKFVQMEMRRLLFIFSLLITQFVSLAQESEPDSVFVPKRTLIPSFYIDYGKFLTFGSTDERKYEGGAELLFKEKFPFIIEVGHASLTPADAFLNGRYESEGFYYRIGSGFYSQINPKNKLGITFRYGFSSFDEVRQISIESPSELQPDFVETTESGNLSASWFETVIYSDRRINNFLSIGLNLRLRVLISYDEQSPIDTYSIPGYGRSFDQSIPAANLFLKVSF